MVCNPPLGGVPAGAENQGRGPDARRRILEGDWPRGWFPNGPRSLHAGRGLTSSQMPARLFAVPPNYTSSRAALPPNSGI